MDRDFQRTTQGLPDENLPIDWISPAGGQFNGGYRIGHQWFIGNVYVYYTPIAWRYSTP